MRVTSRSDTEKNLRRELAEKDVLFTELDHRMKNIMMMISGLLSLEASRAEHLETRAALRAVMRRVQGVDVANRALLKLGALDRVDLGAYLTEVLEELMALEGRRAVRFEAIVEPVETTSQQASVLGMVAGELATNALKHAFPDGGGQLTLHVRATDPDHAEIVIADNGVGWTVRQRASDAGGVGAHLVKALCGQAGCSVDVTSEGGTRATITVALVRPSRTPTATESSAS